MDAHRLLRSEQGQGLMEYAMLIMLVAIVVVGILALFGSALGTTYGNIRNQLPF